MKALNLGVYTALLGVIGAGSIYAVFEYSATINNAEPDVKVSDANIHTPPVNQSGGLVANAPSATSQSELIDNKNEASKYADALTTERSLIALRRELSRLKAEVANLNKRLSGVPGFQDNLVNVDTQRPDASSHAQEEQQRSEQMAAIDSAFRREAKDADWSGATRTQVTEALAAVSIDYSNVLDLECRSTTCRLELANNTSATGSNGDQVALDRELPLLTLQLASSLPNMASFQRDDGKGGTNTVLYFSRDTEATQSITHM